MPQTKRRWCCLLAVALSLSGIFAGDFRAEAAEQDESTDSKSEGSAPDLQARLITPLSETEAGGALVREVSEETTDITASETVLQKLKAFPMMGKEAAGLLQLAEEGLGFNLSNLELGKIAPLLADLQKSTHEHYLVTKAAGKKHMPSPLLKRFLSRKSRSKVVKTMKKFAPNMEEGELIEQLDVVTQLINQLHSNPGNTMEDIMGHVAKVMGFKLEPEDVQSLATHMKWAHTLISKFFPQLPEMFGAHSSEEL